MARRRPPSVHGVVVVDKPAGITSHDVVGVLRRRLGERRIGHAGTLDPGATGVLVVGVGNATRLLRFVSGSCKRYVGEVVLGTETSTLDDSGEVTATHEMAPSMEEVHRAAQALTGDIQQVPPMVSALKVDGVRLHQLARQGIDVERVARPVTVSRFEVHRTDEAGVLAIDVECSAGTYVRSLAADLGRLLGGGAHLRRLRRLAVGSFDICESRPPDQCELLPVAAAVRDLHQVTVDDIVAALVANGRVLASWPGDGPWAVSGADGRLLAVYERVTAEEAKPSVVLAPEANR